MSNRFQVWLLLVVVIGLYAESFLLPALSVSGKTGPSYDSTGRVVVHPGGKPWGPVRLTGNICFQFALRTPSMLVWWLPNPLLWIGCVLMIRNGWKLAALVGAIASLLAAYCAFAFLRSPTGAVHIGCWVWVGSMVLLAVGAMWSSRWETRYAQEDQSV